MFNNIGVSMKYYHSFLMLIILTFLSCAEEKPEPAKESKTCWGKDSLYIIKETYLTKWDDTENIDSPAFWQSKDKSKNWLIATAKEGHCLAVYNAENGERLKTIGKEGDSEGEFSRPNGIWVIDDMAFVVERDNNRIQVLSLPDFKTVLMFGQDKLINAYGLTVFKENDYYRLWVTDNYETKNEEIPPDSLLNKRVLEYKISNKGGNLNAEFIKYIGDTTEKGALRIVESIYADPENNLLMIAEEDERNTHIKVYDLDGNFIGKTIGEGDFKYQAEGIALYKKEGGKGFWIFTDQADNHNTFRIYSRRDFKYLCRFQPEETTNTDGVWLTQTSFPGFEEGAFFAVNNDGGVGAFSWKALSDTLCLKCD